MSKANKAIFLDRDGTVNVGGPKIDILRNIRQLRLLPGATSAIKKFNRLGFLVIIITNQPVIARGWLSEKEVDEIHALLIKRLSRKDAKIEAIYYCPHHPNANLKKYRINCRCRKPGTGLIKKAATRYKIDPRRSFVIGDMTQDILAGKKAGAKTILVKTGFGGRDRKHIAQPDHIVKNLSEAAKVVKRYGK